MGNNQQKNIQDKLDLELDFLNSELRSAHDTYSLLLLLNDLHPNFIKEFGVSATFWYLVRQSLLEVTMTRLSRCLIREKNSLSLFSILTDINRSLVLFDKEHFEDRKKQIRFGISPNASWRPLDKNDLDKHILFSNEQKNPLLIKLKKWRHKRYSHIDRKVAVGDWEELKDAPLLREEILELINKAMDIINTYMLAFKSSSYSKRIHMHDDIKSSLEIIKQGILSRESQSEEWIKEATK